MSRTIKADEPCFLNDMRELLSPENVRELSPHDRGLLRDILLRAVARINKEPER